MKRRQFTAAAATAAAAGSFLRAAGAAPVTESDAAAGVRAALERGAVAAVGLLGRPDGFLANPKVRIPLPDHLQSAVGLLRATGQSRRVDELEVAMNRAAEAAVPQARALLVDAVKSISVEDALRIVRGGPTSATDFFAAKTRAPLTERFLPIVTRATAKVQLADRYNAIASKAAGLGLVRGDQADVQHYVTAKSLDGLYLTIGEQEKKIRADPVGTGSAILQKVFGR